MKNYYTTTELLPQLLPEFSLNNTRYFSSSSSSSSKILHIHIITKHNQLNVYICIFKNLLLPLLPKPKNLKFTGFSNTYKGSSDFSNYINPLNFSRSRNYYLKKQFSENVDFSGFFQVVVRLEGM